ncbi:MAG TPA: ADOP family duplicated permease [Terriglobia bacterium]|nr:ADOP family duplicated permease [Terriglobia bacterium]
MTGLWQDMRHALRVPATDPAYVLAASVMLALGIGVNVAIFSAACKVFFPSLPFPEANSLVVIYEQAPREGITKFPLPYLNYLLVRQQTRIFDGVALYISPRAGLPLDLTEPGHPQKLSGAVVSANFFKVLGVKPLLGRTFRNTSTPGVPQPVAVIGYQLWQQLFSGSRSALGEPLVINRKTYDVIGVMPPSFAFPKDTKLWLPGSSPATVNAIMNVHAAFVEFLPSAVARLRTGISPMQAETLLKTPLAHLREPHLPGWPPVTLKLVPLYNDLYGAARLPLAILAAAAAFVLLIAWVVVSILCWIRAMRREKEIAVRAALGAGKWRAMRQLAAENGLVSLAGTAAAVLVGAWTTRIIPALIPSHGIPVGGGFLDWHVLVFLVLAAALSATLPGIWTAWSASRLDIARTLQEGSYSSSLGQGRRRLLNTLVSVLICLTLVLTAGAALLVENFRRATEVRLGWDPTNVWISAFNLHGPLGPSGSGLARLFDNVVREIEQLPGTEVAAIADAVPIPGSAGSSISVTRAQGSPRALPVRGLNFDGVAVSPDYFKALGIPLLNGRWFSEADCVNRAAVAVVDESFAREFWGRSNPVGQHITASRMDDGRVLTVVGVVGASRMSGYFSAPEPTVYTPIPARLMSSAHWLLVRMRVGVTPPMNGIRQALGTLGSGSVPSQPRPASQILEQAGVRLRARATLLSLFAILALALGAAGSYAVTAYAARQRVHEFGIRIALGSTRGGIVRVLLGQTLWSLVVGLSTGWVVTLSLAPVLRTLLYHARATDLPLFLIVSALLSSAILVASLLPAWRVSRLNPADVLRRE